VDAFHDLPKDLYKDRWSKTLAEVALRFQSSPGDGDPKQYRDVAFALPADLEAQINK